MITALLGLVCILAGIAGLVFLSCLPYDDFDGDHNGPW